MNRRAVLAGALCLFAIGLGVYVLTLRTERDTARTEAQEARQDAATWKAAAQSGEAAVRELAAAKATAEAAAAERDATIKALTRDRDEQRRKLRQCGMTKRLAIGVLLLCLPLFSGCSGRREVAAVPLVIREEVPMYLTEPTPAPVLAGDTNLDLVGHVFDWQAALGACNADKAAIRAAAGKE